MITATNITIGHKGTSIGFIPDLTVSPGEIACVMGPSGSGKTTLFKTFAGEIPPVSGEFTVGGDHKKQDVARTIQGAPLLHWLTVAQNIHLASNIRGVHIENSRDVAAALNIEHLLGVYPDRLSGGERVRASLAVALTSDPNVLILDEPFSQLDFSAKRRAADVIFQFVRRRGVATIFATHDMTEALDYSDKIYVFNSHVPAELVAIDRRVSEINAYQIEKIIDGEMCS